MTRRVSQYPENIMRSLRLREGLAANDTSHDAELNQMDPNTAFDEVCGWDGLVNYGTKIRGWMTDIYGIDFEDYR